MEESILRKLKQPEGRRFEFTGNLAKGEGLPKRLLLINGGDLSSLNWKDDITQRHNS